MNMMISTHVEASKIGRQVVDQVIDSKVDHQADSMSGLSNGEVNLVKLPSNRSKFLFGFLQDQISTSDRYLTTYTPVQSHNSMDELNNSRDPGFY